MSAKKLNNDQRLLMANFACERFVSIEARAKEDAAFVALRDFFVAAYKANVEPHLDVLRAIGVCSAHRDIHLPYSITAPVGPERAFTRPDGVTVTRPPEIHSFDRPDDRTPRSFNSWAHAKSGRQASGARFIRGVVFDEPLMLPCVKGREPDLTFGATCAWLDIASAWFDQKALWKAVFDLYVAGADRRRIERQLQDAMIRLIAAAKTYEEIKEVWPEVEELADDLFPVKAAPIHSIVALSDEDKAMLCANMRERGATSTLCAA